ncbi:hypothetical protein OEG84_12645 [Hoeflea sp. G2-23]|uniref:Uncharacterized protein n=1 Tax=Hoeflea algicola TaxID=2983763 RepID=A0ABT3Z9S4_9HYPH|nr:hypothetical protein [Hoeflea algicola]MCY0148539.1 hypothetical protein [Hoeflea algicola]
MRAALPSGINQTAKRNVTRMSDYDPKERKKENELDPNTQLEKPTLSRKSCNDCFARPKLVLCGFTSS